MGVKRNPLLAAYEAKLEREYRKKFDFTLQLAQDAACIAAHKVLGMGAGRADKFCVEYVKTLREIAELVREDSKDDKEIWYTKATVDEQLKQILGDNFQPWEVRYGEVPANDD